MPQKRNSSRPPAAMTWAKALPVLILAGAFDLIRVFFEMFWFFGPVFAGAAAAAAAQGGVLGAVAGVIAGGAAATVGAPALEAFGIIMAIAVGLIGWMTIGLVLLLTNARIFRENAGNALWFVGSLLISEVPLVGTLPALTGSMVKMYSAQIKKEKAALRAYEKAHAAEQLQERQQQSAHLMQDSIDASVQNDIY